MSYFSLRKYLAPEREAIKYKCEYLKYENEKANLLDAVEALKQFNLKTAFLDKVTNSLKNTGKQKPEYIKSLCVIGLYLALSAEAELATMYPQYYPSSANKVENVGHAKYLTYLNNKVEGVTKPVGENTLEDICTENSPFIQEWVEKGIRELQLGGGARSRIPDSELPQELLNLQKFIVAGSAQILSFLEIFKEKAPIYVHFKLEQDAEIFWKKAFKLIISIMKNILTFGNKQLSYTVNKDDKDLLQILLDLEISSLQKIEQPFCKKAEVIQAFEQLKIDVKNLKNEEVKENSIKVSENLEAKLSLKINNNIEQTRLNLSLWEKQLDTEINILTSTLLEKTQIFKKLIVDLTTHLTEAQLDITQLASFRTNELAVIITLGADFNFFIPGAKLDEGYIHLQCNLVNLVQSNPSLTVDLASGNKFEQVQREFAHIKNLMEESTPLLKELIKLKTYRKYDIPTIKELLDCAQNILNAPFKLSKPSIQRQQISDLQDNLSSEPPCTFSLTKVSKTSQPKVNQGTLQAY